MRMSLCMIVWQEEKALARCLEGIADAVEEMGAEVVASAFLIELDFLNGRKALPDCRVEAVIHYE